MRRILLILLIFFFLESVVSAGIYFTPRLGFRLEYDDNIYFTSSEEISDLVRYVSPGLWFFLGNNVDYLNLDYEYQRVTYTHQSAQNSNRHYLYLRGQKVWSRWRLSFKDDYMHSEDPARIESLIGNINYAHLKYDYHQARVHLERHIGKENILRFSYYNFIFKKQKPYDENTYSNYPYLELIYWFSEPWGIHLEIGENLAQFDYFDDFRELITAATLKHRLNPWLEWQVRFGFSDMHFLGERPDYRLYDLGTGIVAQIAKRTGLSVGVGAFKQSVEDEDNVKGLSAYLNFFRETGRYRIFFEASTGYDEIYFDGEDLGFSRYSVVGGKLKGFLGSKWWFTLRFFHRRDHFIQSVNDVIERTWNTNVYLSRKLTRYLELSFGFLHLEREANLSVYEYRDNRVWLRLTLLKRFSF